MAGTRTAPASPEALRSAVRALAAERRYGEAWDLLRPQLLRDGDPAVWSAARQLLAGGRADGWRPHARRTIRLALLCTYEATELAEQLELACRAFGIEAAVYAAPYGQLEQEALDPASPLSAFDPTHVLIAAAAEDLAFPAHADDAAAALDAELQRWLQLWEALAGRGARVLQHGFVVPDESPYGHLAMRLAGSRLSLIRRLNMQLAEAAGSTGPLLVDVDRLASSIGKRTWCDPRLWHAARRPYAQAVVPALARETAAVLAADVGLAPRCVVVDLDNTLWGGVVGDDGIDSLVVGDGADGEAFAAFQEYLVALKERGVLLAVASKNDLDAAREPFERLGGMRLTLGDFAAFVADWRPKSEQIAEIARTLDLGLDALAFVDDNAAECAQVAAALPDVVTIPLDVAPSEYVRTVSRSLRVELSALSAEDRARTESYVARRRADELRSAAPSVEDFWRSLEMTARVRPVDATTVARTAELTQKTNQFNLTLVRRTPEQVERLLDDPRAICRTLELKDRFARHGIVGVVIAIPDEEDGRTAVIDTLLLSCRVIGRTAERHLVAHVAAAAEAAGYSRLRASYVPGPRNGLVARVYDDLGFDAEGDGCWTYELARGPIPSTFIRDAA